MKDGYRYFIARPTAEDGNPEQGSDPSYFRCPARFHGPVNFWNGSDWEYSIVGNNLSNYLSDVFRSGATVRELLDDKDVPRGNKSATAATAESTYVPPQQLTPGGPVHGGWTIVATPPVGGQDD
jgi:hypothetical protein